jgi:competence protein ComEC
MELRTRTTVTTRTFKALIAAALFIAAVALAGAVPSYAGAFDTLRETAPAVDLPSFPSPVMTPAFAPMRAMRPLKVFFLNVGQGDAAYIELPNGQNALIDAGPSKAKTSYLATFLAERNVTKIDNVVLTHPHSDHYTGLKYVFSTLPVGNFYDTQADNTGTAVDEAIRAQAQQIGANIVHPAAGALLGWDGEVQVKVLNSCSSPIMSGSGQFLNDCSIVLKITYQNTSVLFTGDMQEDVEADLVAAFGAGLKSDVLKVGHHGSQYSSSAVFLAAVSPSDAVISVGKNSYGHPTPDCRARLAAAGALLHRTDTDGTIEYAVGVRSFSPLDNLASLKY